MVLRTECGFPWNISVGRLHDTVREAQDVPDESFTVLGSQDMSKNAHVRNFRSDASGSRNRDSAE